MNYIKQINAFWNWRKYNTDISHAAVDLYFAILNCANEVGWKTQVNIPNSTLMGATGISSRSRLSDLRNKLVQKGLIEYAKGKKGTTAPGYIIRTLYSTYSQTDNEICSTYSTYNSTYNSTYSQTNQVTNSGTIYKHKHKYKQNETITAAIGDEPTEIFERYENVTNKTITPTMEGDVDSFISAGTEVGLILEIIDYAVDSGKGNWNYMRATLNNLAADGIRTLSAYKAQKCAQRTRKTETEQSTQKSKFYNYTDSVKSDYAELEDKLLDMQLEGSNAQIHDTN